MARKSGANSAAQYRPTRLSSQAVAAMAPRPKAKAGARTAASSAKRSSGRVTARQAPSESLPSSVKGTWLLGRFSV
jgi:hypothetical protein